MSGSFNDRGELEVADGRLIFLTGKKKSGKSVLAKMLVDSYPGDLVVLDVAGDDGPMGDGVIDLQGDAVELSEQPWPEYRRHFTDDGKPLPMTLRYVPDPGSPTSLADSDAVVGMALRHAKDQREKSGGKAGCCLLIHEIGVVAPVQQTQPHMRRLLMHNRHVGATAIMCGPRPLSIDPLVVQQADLVYAFELPNEDDRKKLAKTVGWSVPEWDAAMQDLGRHEYLRFDSNEPKPEPGQRDMRVLHFPPLPPDVVAAASRTDRQVS